MFLSALLSDLNIKKALFSDFLLPVSVGVLAFLASNSINTWRMRKRQSLLGSVVVDVLIEEVSNGIAIMESVQRMMNGQRQMIGDLPRKSWSGMNTINDDILERIICTSRGKKTDGFPPREVRKHLKNYFEHMCQNFDSVTMAIRSGANWQQSAQLYMVNGRYIEAANKVCAMLQSIKQLLDKNAVSWKPK